MVRLWRGDWDTIIPFFQFLPKIREVAYTTNAIESIYMSPRKLTHNRRIFPNDDSALKSLFLAIRCISIFHLFRSNLHDPKFSRSPGVLYFPSPRYRSR